MQSLELWLSVLEEKCDEDGKVVKDVQSIFTFEPLLNLQLEFTSLLKTCWTQ